MAEHRKARFQQSTAQLNGMTAFPGKYVGDHRKDQKMLGIRDTQNPRQIRKGKTK